MNGYTNITFSTLFLHLCETQTHKQTHTYTMDFNKQQAVKHKKEANYDSIQNIDYIYQIITGRLMTCKPDQICSLYVVSACHFESVTELNCTDGKLAES